MCRHLAVLLSGLAATAAAPTPATSGGDDPIKDMLKSSIFADNLNYDAAFLSKERLSTPLAYQMQEHLRKENGQLQAAPMTAPERHHNPTPYITEFNKCVGIKYVWLEGDSLNVLAKKYCVPFQLLRESNIPFWFAEERDIMPGDTVCVPRVDFHKSGCNQWPLELAAGRTVTTPKAFNNKCDNATQPIIESDCKTGKTHVVHSGETLWSILESYSLKTEQFAVLNSQMNETAVLQIGQVICLPSDVVKVANNGEFHNEASQVQGMQYPAQPQWMANGNEQSTETSWYHKANWAPMNHNLTQYNQARVDDLKVKVPLANK